MKFLLDEGVPVSVGEVLKNISQNVIQFGDSGLVKSSADNVVCAAALASGAVLVAADKDMKKLARGHGITKARFGKMGLIRFECPKTMAAERTKLALSLIQHEHGKVLAGEAARIFIVIGESVMRLHR